MLFIYRKNFNLVQNGVKHENDEKEFLKSFYTLLDLFDNQISDSSNLTKTIHLFITQFEKTNPGKELKSLLKNESNYVVFAEQFFG